MTEAYCAGRAIEGQTGGSAAAAAEGLKVGALTITGRAVLAPMAGVTDWGMRRLAQRFGAAMTVTEMVAGESLSRRDQESLLRVAGAGLGPHVVQIAGCTAHSLAEGARMAEACGAAAVDINMGCPAKRVIGGLAGSALMRDPAAAARLIAATVRAVAIPVTVKMRLGWDEASVNAPDLARRAEQEGVTLITVHGRTRQQFYKGRADWAAVAAVRQAVGVPVVVNGDCACAEDAAAMLRQSGADAVMIGRAAVGRPWLVGQIAAFLRSGRCGAEPDLAERRAAALEHYDSILAHFGLHRGIRHARKHLSAYAAEAARQHGGAVPAGLARRLVTSEDAGEVKRLLASAFETCDRAALAEAAE